MAREVVRTSIALEPDVMAAVKNVAYTFGCVSPTGPQVGEGSISGLLRAIASEELVVVPSSERAAEPASTMVRNMEAAYTAIVEMVIGMNEAGRPVRLPARDAIPEYLLDRYDSVMANGGKKSQEKGPQKQRVQSNSPERSTSL